MKKFILTIVTLIASTIVIAQNDTSVTTLLNKALAPFDKGGVELNGVVHYGDGSFNLSLKMDHERFCGSVADLGLWFDGKTQWLQRSGEIYISEPTPQEQLATNPYLLMKDADKYFDMRRVDSKQLPEGTADGIQLTPRSSADFQSARLFFDKNNRLVALQASFQNGTVAKIDIISFKNGLKYKNSDFACNTKNYSAEVIDMR